jgi:hypothetical protein
MSDTIRVNVEFPSDETMSMELTDYEINIHAEQDVFPDEDGNAQLSSPVRKRVTIHGKPKGFPQIDSAVGDRS